MSVTPTERGLGHLRRQRWAKLGPLQVGLSLPADTDRRVVESAPVRRVVKPLLRRLRGANRVPEAPFPADANEPLSAQRPSPSDLEPATRRLIDRVARISWYHSIDLGHGVVTPGLVDHRDQLPLYHLPESLAGKRCLDVATWDGFWAFEMEKRGASEVVAIDVARMSEIDFPVRFRQEMMRTGGDSVTGDGFRLAHETLGSSVKRKTINVYDLSPEILGEFDFIFTSDLLLHLRDPQLALDRIRSVCRGTLFLADVCDPGLDVFGELCLAEYPLWVPGEYVWWRLGVNTLKRMVWVAGFETVDELSRLVLNAPKVPADGRLTKVVLRAGLGVQPRTGSPEAHLLAAR